MPIKINLSIRPVTPCLDGGERRRGDEKQKGSLCLGVFFERGMEEKGGDKIHLNYQSIGFDSLQIGV